MFQTSGEVFVPLFWGVGTLIVLKIYFGASGYVFNDIETLNNDDILEKVFVPT